MTKYFYYLTLMSQENSWHISKAVLVCLLLPLTYGLNITDCLDLQGQHNCDCEYEPWKQNHRVKNISALFETLESRYMHTE